MKYQVAKARQEALRSKMSVLRERLHAVQARVEPEAVEDHHFHFMVGRLRQSLTELFGEHRDLIVVHNMGKTCAYCTLWADGYNGLYPHLKTRAAFVVMSPDAPAEQRRFARSRGWRFSMASDAGARFAHYMGYASADGRCRPGISAFRKVGDKEFRVADTGSRPLDDFCALWHLLELFPGGTASWQPKLRYGKTARRTK